MKKKNSISTPYWLLVLLLLLAGQPLAAQPPADSTTVPAPAWTARSFSPETLAALEKDGQLDYALVRSEGDSLLDRFKRWLAHRLSAVLGGASDSGLMDILFYLFCIGAGLFLVIRFLDIDLSSLLHRKAATAAPITLPEGISENIHELDFDAELAAAAQSEAWARAVRLLYLSALKNLADGEHIRWEPGKTNQQYQQEVQQPELRRHFGRLGYYFEWTWYGDFPVDEALYLQVRQEWDAFRRKVGIAA
jgi:hypothetical protein